jgi:hypothetical protein
MSLSDKPDNELSVGPIDASLPAPIPLVPDCYDDQVRVYFREVAAMLEIVCPRSYLSVSRQY